MHRKNLEERKGNQPWERKAREWHLSTRCRPGKVQCSRMGRWVHWACCKRLSHGGWVLVGVVWSPLLKIIIKKTIHWEGDCQSRNKGKVKIYFLYRTMIKEECCIKYFYGTFTPDLNAIDKSCWLLFWCCPPEFFYRISPIMGSWIKSCSRISCQRTRFFSIPPFLWGQI